MTDHNLFQEVDEDLERQKLEEMWRRYGPWLIAGALVIVLATAGGTSWRTWHEAKNQEATAGILGIVDHADPDSGKQMAALESFASKYPGSTQAALAQMDAADLAAKADNADRAIQLYDEVAKDSSVDTSIRQLADLLSVRLQMDTGDPAALKKRLEKLSADGAPWQYTAMEFTAYLDLRTNDKAGARRIFTQLSQDTRVPHSLSDRAATMLRYVSE